MLELTFNNSSKNNRFKKGFFLKILEIGLRETGFGDKKIGLSLNIVGKAKIQSLNRIHRNKNKPTDVLSFPLNENGISKYHAINAIMELGDIFICPVIAKEKIEFLVVHGFLHLLGYDHEKSSQEKEKMFSLQERILKNISH